MLFRSSIGFNRNRMLAGPTKAEKSKDYEVDLSKADDPTLNPGDRHVLRNVRDVAVNGVEFPTCIGCHDLHKSSSVKHKRAPRTAICNDCHNAEGPIKGSKPYSVSSALCEY